MATEKECKQCMFSWSPVGKKGDTFCDYLCKTGKRRPYKAAECRLFKIKNKKG